MSNSKISFRLVRVNTEEYATFPEVVREKGKIELKTGFSFALDDEEKAIKCVIRLMFESSEKVFILLQSSCEFEIEPTTWSKWLSTKKDKLTIPKGFARHLVVLTLGTSRGVLHAKTENTEFNSYILPTINVNNFVKEDVKIEIPI